MKNHAAPTDTSKQLLTTEFILLGCMAVVFWASDGMANALLPLFVVDQLGGSEKHVGIIMGAAGITALLSRLWLGRLGDRRGARLLLILGGSITAIGYLILLPATNADLAIASRLVIGGGRAAVLIGLYMLALQIAPSNRQAEATSYVLVAVHSGHGLGPIIGETLRNSVSFDVVWIAIILLTTLSVYLATLLPDRSVQASEHNIPLISGTAIAPGIAAFLGIFAINGFLVFAPLYGREIGLEDVGLVFMVCSFTIVAMRILFGRVPDRFGPIRTSSFALLVTALGALIVAMWAHPTGMFVGVALLAIGISMQSPSFMSMATRQAKDRERGAAVATFTAFIDISNALAGPLFGLLITTFSYQTTFLVGAGMALISLVLVQVVIAPRKAYL